MISYTSPFIFTPSPLTHFPPYNLTPSLAPFPSSQTYPSQTGLPFAFPAFTPLGAFFSLVVKNTGCRVAASIICFSLSHLSLSRAISTWKCVWQGSWN